MSDQTTPATGDQSEQPAVSPTPPSTPADPGQQPPQVEQQSPPVQQQPSPQKEGTNWTAILLGFIVLILLCLLVVVVAPRVSENLNPSEPVAQEPVEVQVTVEVVVPTIEPPQVEVPQPEVQEPDVLPAEGAGEGLQQICGSVGGAAGGLVLLPGIFAFRRRKRSKQDAD